MNRLELLSKKFDVPQDVDHQDLSMVLLRRFKEGKKLLDPVTKEELDDTNDKYLKKVVSVIGMIIWIAWDKEIQAQQQEVRDSIAEECKEIMGWDI